MSNDHLPSAQDNEKSLSITDGMYQDDCCQLPEEKNESYISKDIIPNSEKQVQNHIVHNPKENISKNNSTIAILGWDKEPFDATLQVNINFSCQQSVNYWHNANYLHTSNIV